MTIPFAGMMPASAALPASGPKPPLDEPEAFEPPSDDELGAKADSESADPHATAAAIPQSAVAHIPSLKRSEPDPITRAT